MAVIATLTFDSHQGHNTQWELDILDSTFSGTPVSLIGSKDPIKITWHKDRDNYKPVLGSSAEISVLVQNATQEAALPDFNDGDERQYEVRLRYRDADNNMQPFWCGYIDPVSSEEHFTTYPFELSYKCVDGIGRLEQLTIDRDDFITSSDVADNIPVFTYITRTLRQTGLELPIYVESGIRTASGDALTTTSASAYAFFGEDISDRRDPVTYKDALEGTLATFNCRVFQSRGAWWVVNCSTHGGTGDSESATFAQYVVDPMNVTDYIAGTGDNATVSINLRKSIDGTLGSELKVIDEDLLLTTRRRVGSYEARPSGLIQAPLHVNDDFRGQEEGWTRNTSTINPWSGSLPTGYVRPSGGSGLVFANDSFSDESEGGEAWSIVTNVNRQIINGPGELWFETSNPFQVNQGSPTNIDIRWKTDNVSTAGRDPVSRRIPIRIRLDLDTPTEVRYLNTSTLSALFQGPQTTTTSTLYWNFSLERWVVGGFLQQGNRGNPINGTMSVDVVRGGDQGEWQDANITVAPFDTFEGFFTDNDLPSGTLSVEFYFPQATRNGRKVATENDTNRFRTFVDLVRVTDDFSSDDTDPVYEHVAFTSAARDQVVATRTERYEPAFVSSGPNTFRQFLSSTQYWRTSETSSNATTLEEKITLQKLNDFANRFQYYEGSILNNSSEPLGIHNKVLVNYTTSPNTVSCIVNGGTFSPKFNVWDIFMYFPNQATDIPFGRFFESNVELVGRLFEGRRSEGTYVLGVDPRGLNDTGGQNQTVDENGVMPGQTGYIPTNNSLVTSLPYILEQGTPGEIKEGVLRLEDGVGFEASASNLSILDENAMAFTEETALEFVEFGDITDAGSSIEIPYRITIPRRAEYEGVVIQGEVDPQLPGNFDYDVTFALAAGAAAGTTISGQVGDLRGNTGSFSYAEVVIDPPTGQRYTDTAFTTSTLPDDISLVGFSLLGGISVRGLFRVTHGMMNEMATITITPTTPSDIPAGVDTAAVNLTINEQAGGITNVSLNRTMLAFTSIVGITTTVPIIGTASDGNEVNGRNFSIDETIAGVVVNNFVGRGESTMSMIEVSPGSMGITGTLTVNGSAQPIGGPRVNVTVNFTGVPENSSLIDASETFSLSPGQSMPYVNTLAPDQGRQLEGTMTLTETDADNVISNLSFVQTKFQGNISMTITAPSDSDDGDTHTASIAIGGIGSAEEPYLATLNLTEDLPNGKLATTSYSQRFSDSDSNVSFTGITIRPVTDRFSYASGTTFTVSGGTASNYTYSEGSVSFDLSVALPTFNTDNPIGDEMFNINITAADSPQTNAATEATFGSVSGDLLVIPFTGDNNRAKVSISSDGLHTVSTNSSNLVISGGVTGSFPSDALGSGNQSYTVTRASRVDGETFNLTVHPRTGGSRDDTVYTTTLDDLDVIVTDSDTEGPATSASGTSSVTININGGSAEYSITANGRWVASINASPTNPSGRFRSSGVSYEFVGNGSSGTTMATFGTRTTTYRAEGNDVTQYMHIIPDDGATHTTALHTITLNLQGGGGTAAGSVRGIVLYDATSAPSGDDPDGIYFIAE